MQRYFCKGVCGLLIGNISYRNFENGRQAPEHIQARDLISTDIRIFRMGNIEW
jgi:hypothetical protein